MTLNYKTFAQKLHSARVSIYQPFKNPLVILVSEYLDSMEAFGIVSNGHDNSSALGLCMCQWMKVVFYVPIVQRPWLLGWGRRTLLKIDIFLLQAEKKN